MTRMIMTAIALCIWAASAVAADLGRVPIIWQDEARARQIVAWVYYPAARKAGPPELIMPYEFSPSYESQLSRRFGSATAKIRAAATTDAVMNAPISAGAHPVLIFVPGAGFLPADYHVLIEAMASRGYVVIAISPRPTQLLDYTGLSGDIASAVRQLSTMSIETAAITPASFDTSRIGAFGHSVGGASSVFATVQEPLIKAALNFDGDYGGPAEKAQPTRPLLYVTSEPVMRSGVIGTLDNSEARRERVWKSLSAKASGSRSLRIARTRHLDFLDIGVLKERMSRDKRENRFGTIDPRRALDISVALTAAFFDETLNAKPGTLAATLKSMPEVHPVFETAK